jgi:predicted RNA-binding protein with PUA-like domain
LVKTFKDMAYWLVKSEPHVYSWDQLEKEKETSWEGVRNYAARNNLRDMKKGDKVLFYHSNKGLEIVGIAKVSKTAYPDPTTDNPAWVTVNPVSLAQIKAEEALKEMELVRINQLSVQKVSESEWEKIMELAGEK